MVKTYKMMCTEKEFDHLEKRYFIRDIYYKLDLKPLLECDEDMSLNDFKKFCATICQPELGVTNYRVLKSFLLDCAKENFPDSKTYIRKMNIFAERYGF